MDLVAQAGQILIEFCQCLKLKEKIQLGIETGGSVNIVASYLVGCVDIGADGGPTGLQHIWRAQRRGGHGGSALQPAILFQIRELETSLRIHCQQPWWWQTTGGTLIKTKPQVETKAAWASAAVTGFQRDAEDVASGWVSETTNNHTMLTVSVCQEAELAPVCSICTLLLWWVLIHLLYLQ